MAKRVLYFAHGLESGPWGIKIKYLADIVKKYGFEIESPDYSGMRIPEERVQKLIDLSPQADECLVLLGSSMGGWVSAEASKHIQPDGLFLIAPAVYIGDGYSEEAPSPEARRVTVVHGWNDDIVPVDNVIRYSRENSAKLHLLDSGHRLNDQLPVMGFLLEQFLEELLNPEKYQFEPED